MWLNGKIDKIDWLIESKNDVSYISPGYLRVVVLVAIIVET